MWKHIKRVGFVSAPVGGVMLWFSQNPLPKVIKDADSNIGTNLRFLGWDNPPETLATTTADHIVQIMAFGFLALSAGVFLSWIAEKIVRWSKMMSSRVAFYEAASIVRKAMVDQDPDPSRPDSYEILSPLAHNMSKVIPVFNSTGKHVGIVSGLTSLSALYVNRDDIQRAIDAFKAATPQVRSRPKTVLNDCWAHGYETGVYARGDMDLEINRSKFTGPGRAFDIELGDKNG